MTRHICQVQWTLKPDGHFDFAVWWADGSEIHGHSFEDVLHELTDLEKDQLERFVRTKPPKHLTKDLRVQ